MRAHAASSCVRRARLYEHEARGCLDKGRHWCLGLGRLKGDCRRTHAHAWQSGTRVLGTCTRTRERVGVCCARCAHPPLGPAHPPGPSGPSASRSGACRGSRWPSPAAQQGAAAAPLLQPRCSQHARVVEPTDHCPHAARTCRMFLSWTSICEGRGGREGCVDAGRGHAAAAVCAVTYLPHQPVLVHVILVKQAVCAAAGAAAQPVGRGAGKQASSLGAAAVAPALVTPSPRAPCWKLMCGSVCWRCFLNLARVTCGCEGGVQGGAAQRGVSSVSPLLQQRHASGVAATRVRAGSVQAP